MKCPRQKNKLEHLEHLLEPLVSATSLSAASFADPTSHCASKITMSSTRPHPPALPHGGIQQVFANIYYVKGTSSLTVTPPVSMCFSRNMTIVVQGDELILINTVRLDESGLEELEKLGKVKHALRIGAWHGIDDAFYKDKYGATTWSVEKNYFVGFEKDAEPYMVADKIISQGSELPLKDASIHIIESSTPKEGLLLLTRPEGGGNVVVSGDCLQNWAKSDEYFSLFGRFMMWMAGFLKPHNIGIGWYNASKPKKEEVREKVLGLDYDHVIPAHGEPCIGGATKKYEKAVNALKDFEDN